MKKRVFYLLSFSLFIFIIEVLISCSKSDESNNDGLEPGLYQVTVTELESQPSFVKTVNGISTFVWFRNGIMFFKKGEIEIKYNYTISGKKFAIETIDKKNTYHGYIQKSVASHKERNQLAITKGADGVVDGNMPNEIMNWYDYSPIDMSK